MSLLRFIPDPFLGPAERPEYFPDSWLAFESQVED